MIYLVNCGYALMLIALAIRNILSLRLILMSAQSIFIAYGFVTGNNTVAIWNCIFVALNAFQAVVLIRRRRPVTIPPELQAIYDQTFHHMSRREFLYFWQMGRLIEIPAGVVVADGQPQKQLLLIVDGSVDVTKDESALATLTRGSYVAEMSFLTGEPASADVSCDAPIVCMTWNADNLAHLQRLNYELWNKVHHSLSRELADKVRRTSERLK